MKLTKEEVNTARSVAKDQTFVDFCDDWLAMRAMLEELMQDNECPSCNNIGCHKSDCKLKELLE